MKHQLNLGVRTWLHLNHIRHIVTRRLSVHLERYDLTVAQFGVLAQLQAVPDLSQQALADWLSVTKGNMVGLLNRLEARGLVQRRPDPPCWPHEWSRSMRSWLQRVWGRSHRRSNVSSTSTYTHLIGHLDPGNFFTRIV